MEYTSLRHTCENPQIRVLYISAPQSLNALNTQVLTELEAYIDTLDKEVRVLIVTGDGDKSFVAGADIAEMHGLNEPEAFEFGKLGARVFRKIETLAIPVIAAVNGYALGGGCELALACDIRYASDNARFGQPEVGLGITPGFSGTYRLPKIVGQGIAKEMIYAGKPIKADEALRIGLVNKVFPQAELLPAAIRLAENICAAAPIAVRYAKQCINSNYDMDADEAILLENKLFAKCFSSEDQKEGMGAFLNKRCPAFKNK